MVNLRHAILRIRTLRIISLVVFFVLFNIALFGYEALPLILPVLQSMGNPAKTVGDAFAVLQYNLWEPTFPWLPIASFFIVAVLLGRATCSWVCPFGFIQELLGYAKRRHRVVSPRTHTSLVYMKYLILAAVLFISLTIATASVMGIGRTYKNALGVFAQAPFNTLSPHDTLFGAISTVASRAYSGQTPYNDFVETVTALSILFWVRLFILGLMVAFAILVPRGWCKYLCPVGASLAVLNRFSFLGLKRDVIHCTKESCRRCVEVCPMEVPILDLPWEKFTHPECIYCLECVDACKTKAIKPRIP